MSNLFDDARRDHQGGKEEDQDARKALAQLYPGEAAATRKHLYALQYVKDRTETIVQGRRVICFTFRIDLERQTWTETPIGPRENPWFVLTKAEKLK